MSVFSWMLSPAADAYWYWSRNIVGLVIAATVIGESPHHIPPKWLPSKLRPEAAHHEISKRSWAILVVALALEVPIEMARDAIAAMEKIALEKRIDREHDARLPRHLTLSDQASIGSQMAAWTKLPRTEMRQSVAVF